MPQKPPAANPRSGNTALLLGGLLLLLLVAGGLTYRFVLRKPSPNNAPIVNSTSLAPPATPVPTNPAADTLPAIPPEQAPRTEPQEPAGEGKSAPSATPVSTKPGSKTKATSVAPPYQEAHQNADQALSASRLLDPPEDSALFWARKAKSLGDPAADPIEQEVFEEQLASVQGATRAHDYTAAESQLSQLGRFFPGRPELQRMRDVIQQDQQKYNLEQEKQRQEAALEAQTKHFQFRHRHVASFIATTNNNTNSVFFCSGTLTVAPDGAVRYDCTGSDDPSGRCDHVAFPPGSLRDAKLKSDGSMHLASRQSGNFDFYGDANSLQQALSAIAPLVRH